jgi:fission process protein 1
MLSAQRYVAYTSDIGESFRPIAHPWLVKGAYGISWAYLIGDVSNEGYKAYCRQQSLLAAKSGGTPPNATSALSSASADAEAAPKMQRLPALEDYRTIMAQRAVFQSIASMGLPAFTIHSIVRYSGRALKNAKNTTIRTWGPIGVRFDLIVGSKLFTDRCLAWSSSGSCTSIHV